MPKTLRIAIDGNEANIPNRVGSNVYAFELITAFNELIKSQRDVEVTVLLSAKPIKDLPNERKYWNYKVITPRKFWTQWALPIHLFLNQDTYDVLYTPGHYAPRISSVPYISSVMDLAFLSFPEQFKKNDLLQLKNWTKYSVTNAQKVIAISEYTKKDVTKFYNKKAGDVVLIPPAVHPPTFKPGNKDGKKVSKKFGITDPYIVHVGTIQPRKNITRLIEAYEKVMRKMAASRSKKARQYQLVLVGKIGWLADPIMKRIANSPFSKNIIITGFVTEKEKFTLLKFAQCSAHLGLYEGFGIPPLETLHMGTIPIVSNTTSLPEVVGKAGITTDPYNISSIATALESVLTLSARERAKLRKLGREQIKQFSWENSAEELLKTIEAVAKDHA
jgi:glycosyltransferase involved in cell wall biosynthesis